MNDWRLLVDAINEMIAAARPDLSIVERAGLYGGATQLLSQIEKWIRATAPDAYCFEKIGKVRWHMGAALGFDIDNRHSADQHRAWAYGHLGSLKNQIGDIPALNEE